MKKLFLFLILIFCINFISSEITGEAITGKISSQNFSIAIGIVTDLPEIIIHYPLSGTYLKENEFTFNFTTNAEKIQFNVDNSKNKTLHQNEKISLGIGEHTIKIYATKENKTIEKIINISINPDLFTIKYENYKKNNRGKSTDFYLFPYEEYRKFKNIILENQEYGKINFLENINLINDSFPEDKILDLDENTNISKNKIYLNSNLLPNFNKKSKITFYNITFKNPEILKNGLVCLETECKITNYNEGNLEVEVEGFTTYEIREKPVAETSRTGGTNKKIPSETESFEILQSKIIDKLKEGEIKYQEITLKNKLNTNLEIEIEISEFKNLIRTEENKIILKPNEERKIEFELVAGKDYEPTLYLGKILLSSKYEIKEILFLIEVESKQDLFDVSIKVIKKGVKPNEKVPLVLEMYNLGETDRIDATVEYYIINKNNEIIKKEEETVAVETSLKTLKEIQIPPYTKNDEYIMFTKVNYAGKIATASEEFLVEKEKNLEIQELIIFILITIIILLIFFLIKRRFQKKDYKRKKSKSRTK